MPFVPGTPKPPGSGRKPGTPNKSTKEMRDLHSTITQIALERVHKLGDHIDYLEGHSKLKSASLLMRLIQTSLAKAPPAPDALPGNGYDDDARAEARHFRQSMELERMIHTDDNED